MPLWLASITSMSNNITTHAGKWTENVSESSGNATVPPARFAALTQKCCTHGKFLQVSLSDSMLNCSCAFAAQDKHLMRWCSVLVPKILQLALSSRIHYVACWKSYINQVSDFKSVICWFQDIGRCSEVFNRLVYMHALLHSILANWSPVVVP